MLRQRFITQPFEIIKAHHPKQMGLYVTVPQLIRIESQLVAAHS
ncbi:hypothetical protein Z949_614 [Sulfitobacter guttiformis KCTC 32187]|nr:hypothetical protein Z949_614 [Sulfitobacter guttiformis KCTC 32187]